MHLFISKGKKKYERELDVIKFVRYQRKLKMIMDWLMDKSSRFLSAYQKSNTINLSTESENLSDDSVYAKIPYMLDKDTVKIVHHEIVTEFFVNNIIILY